MSTMTPRRYGVWAGKPEGIPEDVSRCIKSVADRTGWHAYQCRRKRGHGPDGLYCKQHDPEAKAAAAAGRWEAEAHEARQRYERQEARRALLAAMRRYFGPASVPLIGGGVDRDDLEYLRAAFAAYLATGATAADD